MAEATAFYNMPFMPYMENANTFGCYGSFQGYQCCENYNCQGQPFAENDIRNEQCTNIFWNYRAYGQFDQYNYTCPLQYPQYFGAPNFLVAPAPEPPPLGPPHMGFPLIGLQHIGPEHIGPEQMGPQQMGPQQIGPQQIGPQQIGPPQIGPQQIGPQHIGPQQIGPQQIGPPAIGPQHIGPPPIGPSPIVPLPIALPTIGLPTIGLPTIGLPTMGLPTMGLPTMGLPTMGLPTIGIPTVGLPTIVPPPIGPPPIELPPTGPDQSRDRQYPYQPRFKKYFDDKMMKSLLQCGLTKENIRSLPRDLLQLYEQENCGLCCQTLDSIPAARMHYISKNHQKKQKKWLITRSDVGFQRIKELPFKARDLYCELCDVIITSALHSKSHYSGKPHRSIVEGRKIPRNPLITLKGMEDRLDGLIRREQQCLQIGEEEEPNIEAKVAQSELYCEICAASVTCPEQMVMHLNGKRHLGKEKQHILKLMKGDKKEGEQEGQSEQSQAENSESENEEENEEHI